MSVRAVARRLGKTEVLKDFSQIEAVHLMLLHTGEVLYYSGFRKSVGENTETRVWDPETGVIYAPETPSDLFCAGHAFLPDGRLLSTGGTKDYVNMPKGLTPWLLQVGGRVSIKLQRFGIRLQRMVFPGLKELYAFDPAQRQWSSVGTMNRGRWYPTACALPDGRILLLSGRDDAPHTDQWRRERQQRPFWKVNKLYQVAMNREAEVVSLNGSIQNMGEVKGPGIRENMEMPYADAHHLFPTEYPRLHVLPLVTEEERAKYPAGRVFCSGYGPETQMLNLATWEWEHVDNLRFEEARHDGVCVLLPLDPEDNYRPVVMTFGGSVHKALDAVACTTTEIIDLSQTPWPRWDYLRDANGQVVEMEEGRVNGSATLLPDGRVIVLGGNREARWDRPVLEVDVFGPDPERPGQFKWDERGTHTALQVPRGYHATAILLPDARVMVAGTTSTARKELDVELYSPYYLVDAQGNLRPRPQIASVGDGTLSPTGKPALAYDQAFAAAVSAGHPKPIRSAALLRPGAMTHAHDMEQRHIWLRIRSAEGDSLTLEAPPDRHVATPGHYMLFLLDQDGTPSKAAFVWLPV